MTDSQPRTDLDQKNSYLPGQHVKVHSRWGAEYCRRSDGTGSSWEIVKGTVWYVVEKLDMGIYHIDDRCRPDVPGDQPCFEAYVHGVNLEPIRE